MGSEYNHWDSQLQVLADYGRTWTLSKERQMQCFATYLSKDVDTSLAHISTRNLINE